jgi:CCR4-NOT transcription complex subunit 1
MTHLHETDDTAINAWVTHDDHYYMNECADSLNVRALDDLNPWSGNEFRSFSSNRSHSSDSFLVSSVTCTPSQNRLFLSADRHQVNHFPSCCFYCSSQLRSDTFSSLQPTYFPGFAFSWLSSTLHAKIATIRKPRGEICPSILEELLLTFFRQGWSAFHKLLLSLFKFLAPFLQEANLQLASRDLYRGSLRLLLVLLHDFPEFLSEYYFSLCDAIPPRCIQLRNIILSAFPMSIILPGPHLRNIKFDSIPEMGPIPPILSDFASDLKSADLRNNLDQYLLNRGTLSFLTTLKSLAVAPTAA